MLKNRVYTIYLSENVAPGAVAGCEFNINNTNKTFLLKSVVFDIRLNQTLAPFAQLPLPSNFTQEFTLYINPLPFGNVMSHVFEDITAPAAVVNNGLQIMIFKPQQVFFDSFCLRNSLHFMLMYFNRDLLVQYTYNATVTAEIEDIQST